MGRNPRVQYGAPKRCAGTCGQTYPNTEVYFPSAHDPKNPRSLRARCRDCQRAVKHAAYLERKAGRGERKVDGKEFRQYPKPAPKVVTVGRNLVQLPDGKKFRYRLPQSAMLAVMAVIRRAERNTPEIAQKGVLEQFDEVA